ncbi:MAG: HEAT repeat domain-containing protein [Anaerolineae bacterium]|nr:HEAT repeat domain-containing protein [Anaerolineae bacterium]
MIMRVLFGVLSSVGLVGAVFAGWYMRKRARSRKQAVQVIEAPASESPLAGLRHRDWQVRLQTVQALADERDPEVLAALVSRLGDPDHDVREAIINAVTAYGAEALPALTTVLADGERTAREATVEVLARIGGQPVLEGLLQALHDESGWVRVAAVRALASSRDKSVISALAELLSDPYAEVAQAARASLEQMGTAAAKHALKAHADSAPPTVTPEVAENGTINLTDEKETQRRWNAITR